MPHIPSCGAQRRAEAEDGKMGKSRNDYWTPKPKTVATHKIPSGMGGVFDLIVVEDLGERCKVRVVNSGADWNGMEFTPLKSALIPLAA